MNKRHRTTLHRAADIVDQYAVELRASCVVNGAWKGEGVTKIRDEWADMIAIARDLRVIAGERPCS
jgi:hypothetical protein